jgi:ribonuclease HII
MGLLIGMDEAGYGPNLGPLVISATAWEVPGDPKRIDLWERFAGIVEQSPPVENSHIQIADSKVVYSPARGLDNLELGVLSALAVWRDGMHGDDCPVVNGAERPLGSFRELCREIAIRAGDELDGEPWFAGTDHSLPALPSAGLADGWRERCRTHKIRLRAICSDVVLTQRFNTHTRANDNKGEALSEMSMQVLRHILQKVNADDHKTVLIFADKHGGRNRYHEFLPIVFGDRFIRCHRESMEQSRYRMGNAEIRFETKSERHFPVALASMVSKYVRELAMILFNRFWADRQPGLKRTAGYPTDSTRFRGDIAALQKQLGIADDVLWRER